MTQRRGEKNRYFRRASHSRIAARKKGEEMLSKQLNVLINAVSMTNSTETKAISTEKKKKQKYKIKWPIDTYA